MDVEPFVAPTIQTKLGKKAVRFLASHHWNKLQCEHHLHTLVTLKLWGDHYGLPCLCFCE